MPRGRHPRRPHGRSCRHCATVTRRVARRSRLRPMKIPGALLISGVFLFVLSMNLSLRTGRASDWVYYLSLVCLAAGVAWGLVRGPDAVRLAVALATTSLALFVIAMMVTPRTVGGPRPKPLINFPE